MDLYHVYGFPTWEEQAFKLVQNHFDELVSIFTEYAKTGSAGSGSAKALMTMQSTELTNLALDCGETSYRSRVLWHARLSHA